MPQVLVRDSDHHYAEVISAPVGRTPVEDQHSFWLAKTLKRLRRTTNLPLFPDSVYMPVPGRCLPRLPVHAPAAEANAESRMRARGFLSS